MAENGLVPVMNQIFEQQLARLAQMSSLNPNECNHVRSVFQQTIPMLSTSLVSRFGNEIQQATVIQEIVGWLNTYGIELIRAERARQQAYMPPMYGGGYQMPQAPMIPMPGYGGVPYGGMPMGGMPPANYAPAPYGYPPPGYGAPAGNQLGTDMQPPMYASTLPPPAPPPPPPVMPPLTAPVPAPAELGYDSVPLHQKGSKMTSLDDECASFGDLYISDTNEYYTFVTLMFSNPKTTDQVKGIITEQMYQRNMKGAMCVNWEEPLPKNVQSKELVDLLRTDLGPVPTDHNTFRAQISDWLSLFVEAVNVTDATKKFFHRLFIELVNRRTVTGMFYSDDTKMLVFDTFDELMDAYNSVSDDETIAKFREQKSFDHALDLTVLNVIEQLKDIMLANNLLKKKMLGFNVDIKTIKTESDRSGNVKNLPVRIQQQTCLEQLVHPEYPLVGFMMIDESTTVNVVYGKDINGLTVVTKW